MRLCKNVTSLYKWCLWKSNSNKWSWWWKVVAIMVIKISLMQTENNLGRQRHCIDHPSHRPTLCWAIATSKKRWRGPRGKTWKFKSENSAQVSSTLYSVWFILPACLSPVSDIVIHCPSSSYLVSYWMNSISSANLLPAWSYSGIDSNSAILPFHLSTDFCILPCWLGLRLPSAWPYWGSLRQTPPRPPADLSLLDN